MSLQQVKLHQLTSPGSKLCSVTAKVIWHSVNFEQVLHSWHEISNQHPNWLLLWPMWGTGILFCDVFGVRGFIFTFCCPSHHIHFYTTLWTWPFQGDIVWVNKRRNVWHGIWSCNRVNAKQLKPLTSIYRPNVIIQMAPIPNLQIPQNRIHENIECYRIQNPLLFIIKRKLSLCLSTMQWNDGL